MIKNGTPALPLVNYDVDTYENGDIVLTIEGIRFVVPVSSAEIIAQALTIRAQARQEAMSAKLSARINNRESYELCAQSYGRVTAVIRYVDATSLEEAEKHFRSLGYYGGNYVVRKS